MERGFELEEMLRASAEVLGKGTVGTTYKAVFDMGMVVAVKRLKDVLVSENEFKAKIESVGRWSMRIWCLCGLTSMVGMKSFLYEYMPMGSLSALLHGEQLLFLFYLVLNLIFPFRFWSLICVYMMIIVLYNVFIS